MTIADWCILAACLLPVVTVLSAKLASQKGANAYDNSEPRRWEAEQTGWRARAVAAQANGFEALPLFIAAIIIAQQAGANQIRIDTLALAFIGLRLLYNAAYLANLAAVRTPVWLAATGVSIAILVMR